MHRMDEPQPCMCADSLCRVVARSQKIAHVARRNSIIVNTAEHAYAYVSNIMPLHRFVIASVRSDVLATCDLCLHAEMSGKRGSRSSDRSRLQSPAPAPFQPAAISRADRSKAQTI